MQALSFSWSQDRLVRKKLSSIDFCYIYIHILLDRGLTNANTLLISM